MIRLTTTSDKGGVAFTFDLDITCKPSEAQKILRLAEKLKHYEDLEDKGRMIELPCAVGDTVYQIIESISFGEVGDGSSISRRIDKKEFHLSLLDEFGKNIFLTKEEAKAKLKEMEGAE